MTLALLAVLALPALAAPPEGDLGAAFQSLRDSVLSRAAAPAPRVPAIRPVVVAAPAQEEAERSQCPRDYQVLSSQPDGDLYSYLGYRYVRSDKSTCEREPSDRVLYLAPQTTQVRLAPSAEHQSDLETYRLEAPEYRIRRNFYFRTQLDGSRLSYAYDFRVDTGRKIPESVILEFPNRSQFPLLPWEAAETFELRYGVETGASATPLETGYEYRQSKTSERDADGRLVTRLKHQALKKKVLTAPDPEAVKLGLGAVDGLFTVVLEDRWARYYQGAKLGLRLTLHEHRPLFPDRVVYEFDVELDSSGRIFVHPEQDRWNAQRRHGLKSGHTYYADWSFRRAASRVTSDVWVEKGRTERFRY